MQDSHIAEQHNVVPDEIRVYITSLLDASGLQQADKELRESMIQNLYKELDAYIIDQIVDYMPAEKLEAFTELIQKNPSKDELDLYIRMNIPNAQDVLTVAFADFRNRYLQAAKELATE